MSNVSLTDQNLHLPFADSPLTLYIAQRIEAIKHKKSEREIAMEIGYEKPNMISMMKRGEIRVPIDRVSALATALGANEMHLLRLALEEYLPDVSGALRNMGTFILSAQWIDQIRQVSSNRDPKVTPEVTRAVETVLAGSQDSSDP